MLNKFVDFTFEDSPKMTTGPGSDWVAEADPDDSDRICFKGEPKTTWGKNVQLSAHREDEESYRINRLKSVVAYLELDPRVDMELNCLHDHKGVLSAYFYEVPRESDLLAIHKAWKEQEEEEMEVFYRTGDFETVGRRTYLVEEHFRLSDRYYPGIELKWEHQETILRVLSDDKGLAVVIPKGEDVKDYIGDDILSQLNLLSLERI